MWFLKLCVAVLIPGFDNINNRLVEGSIPSGVILDCDTFGGSGGRLGNRSSVGELKPVGAVNHLGAVRSVRVGRFVCSACRSFLSVGACDPLGVADGSARLVGRGVRLGWSARSVSAIRSRCPPLVPRGAAP